MCSIIFFAGLSCLFVVEGSSAVHHNNHHHHKHHHHHHHHKKDEAKVDPADVETQARDAREAASSAKQAADVANQVAVHSVHITTHAQSALKHAQNALHGARVETSGLSSDQQEYLRKAEEKLKAATQKADYGRLSDAKYAGQLKDAQLRDQMKSAGYTDAEIKTELDKYRDATDAERTALESKLRTLQDKLDKKDATGDSDAASIRTELRTLREKLAAKRLEEANKGTKDTVVVDTDTGATAEEMEQKLRELEHQVKSGDYKGSSEDEVKAEMERLRTGIDRLEGHEPAAEESETARLKKRLRDLQILQSTRAKEREVQDALRKLRALKAAGKPIPEGSPTEEELEGLLKELQSERGRLEKESGVAHDADVDKEIVVIRSRLGMKRSEGYGKEYGSLELDVGRKKGSKGGDGDGDEKAVDLDSPESDGGKGKTLPGDGGTTMSKGAFDIDTEMPYGELEPFGREDTAQELTESSIKESDEMVDQLERAEVAEEKRAVFRALTRLRGAAITSYDGVARAQTGNIDEYNKVHKWRKTHPLHHLADEESDISKWAFPDNADF